MVGGQHPNTRTRSPSDNNTRILVLVPDVTVTWIEQEVAEQPITLQIARNVGHAVSALVEDPPPRATIFVVDFDAIGAAELLELHSIRERGWFGAVIGLGKVPAELKASLAIGHVLAQPLRRGALNTAISRAGVGLPTTKIPKL
jgi:hypothetical protein